MRVPASVMTALSDALTAHPGGGSRVDRGTVEEATWKVPAGRSFLIGEGQSMKHTDSFSLEHLLARKLGLAEALVSGDFVAEARLAAGALEAVADPIGGDEAEWTLMATYEVVVKRGAGHIPTHTAAYSKLIWSSVGDLQRAVANKDALIVDDTLDPFEVCIQGLCVHSAVFVVRSY